MEDGGGVTTDGGSQRLERGNRETVLRAAEDRDDGETGALHPLRDVREVQLSENEVELDGGGASFRKSGPAVSGSSPRASPARPEETLG